MLGYRGRNYLPELLNCLPGIVSERTKSWAWPVWHARSDSLKRKEEVMKVILQHNVVKLGKVGDIVDISDGYYRNFLQPRKLAIVATTGSLKKREEDLETIRRKQEQAHKETTAFAERITALEKITIYARDGEGGKLYGKVTTKEIAEVLKKQLNQEVDKRLIKINEDITALGSYKASIKLTADVHADITVNILSEGNSEASAKAAAPVAAAD